MSELCEWIQVVRPPTICHQAANTPLASVAYALVEIRQRGRTEERLTHLSTHFSFQKDKARSRREDGTPARNTDSFNEALVSRVGA